MNGSRRQSRGGRRRGRSGPRRPGSAGPDQGEDRERPVRRSVPEMCELSPFSAFCALYLGITDDVGYRRQDRRAVAKRFGITEDELADYLESNGICAAALEEARFDVESARLDIRVAPPGISRVELARSLFEEFLELSTPG